VRATRAELISKIDSMLNAKAQPLDLPPLPLARRVN